MARKHPRLLSLEEYRDQSTATLYEAVEKIRSSSSLAVVVVHLDTSGEAGFHCHTHPDATAVEASQMYSAIAQSLRWLGRTIDGMSEEEE